MTTPEASTVARVLQLAEQYELAPDSDCSCKVPWGTPSAEQDPNCIYNLDAEERAARKVAWITERLA